MTNHILGSVYASDIRAASADLLSDKIATLLAQSGEYSMDDHPITQGVALHMLVEEDAARVQAQLRHAHQQDLSQHSFTRLAQQYAKQLEHMGIASPPPEVFIVTAMPAPYQELDAWGLTCDSYDESVFGIPSGVYLRKDKVTPYFTPAMLAHELVHLVAGTQPQHYLARGLEEGIADVIQIVLSEPIMGWERATNIVFNSRVEEPLEQHWRVYTEAFRQALLIYLTYGLSGLVALLDRARTEGRVAIRHAEEQCVNGDYDSLDLPAGGWDPRMVRFARMMIGFPVSQVVSPLAYYLATQLQVGMTEGEVLEASGVEPNEGLKALHELQERCYVILIREGRIASDETKGLMSAKALRFEVPE